MSGRHQDRVVLVTGASRGIGRAAALHFVEAGAQVIALARTVGGLEALDDEAKEKTGRGVTLIPCDLTEAEQVAQLPAALAQRFGRLDALVLNAGSLSELTPVADLPDKEWRTALELNVTANLALIRGLHPLLQLSDAGRVVAITSGRARKFKPFWGAYSATKAALEALIRVYATELETTKIRANLLDPGATATVMRQTAMPGEDQATLPQPADIAPLIGELAAAECERQGEIVAYREWREDR